MTISQAESRKLIRICARLIVLLDEAHSVLAEYRAACPPDTPHVRAVQELAEALAQDVRSAEAWLAVEQERAHG